jgi:chemotaxis family two-component system sensor kinase Cph1
MEKIFKHSHGHASYDSAAINRADAERRLKSENLKAIGEFKGIKDAAFLALPSARDSLNYSEQGRKSAENAAQISESENKAKSDFIANMSHEIRTPMSAIIGLANVLMTTELNDAQRQLVSVLQASADDLMLLINDLLDIEKIESGYFDSEYAPFNMLELFEDVISAMSLRAQEKNIKLAVRYEAATDRKFIGDSINIGLILLHLVGNAIKFNAPEGTVSLVFANDGSAKDRGRFTMSVIDNGIGIPENQLERIFEKFIQADSTITRRYGGTGLGLAISKTLAEQMGGYITVASEHGKGSTFALHLYLPVEDSMEVFSGDENQNASPVQPNNPVDLPILLVEDYQPNILVMRNMLENFGYQYEVAHTGQEAINNFSPGKYSAILLDIEMPVMDGYEATRHVRRFEQIKNVSNIPIIAMTAHALKGDREKCIASGMSDYISMPFKPSQLHELLVKYSKPAVGAERFTQGSSIATVT